MIKKISSYFTFGQKLFLSVSLLLCGFALLFVFFQYYREKEYKTELLNSKLQSYNTILNHELKSIEVPSKAIIDSIINHIGVKNTITTIVTNNGDLVYDNENGSRDNLPEFFACKEVKDAIAKGSGYDIRKSTLNGGKRYFYSASRYNNYIIRSALISDTRMVMGLQIDPTYIIVILILTLVFMLFFYNMTRKLGRSVNTLRDFTMHVEHNEPYDYQSLISAFSNDELGEISQHIIRIYQHLLKTKEALYIEREKLIAHLHSNREGLCVFTDEKKGVLANPLFIQYSNIISDHNLSTTEEVFNIPEFAPITSFVNEVQNKPIKKEEKRFSLMITKDSHIFNVECIVFQDNSFEISISDVTKLEEQVILKRQLTQNIAHELKTPVSSIQGYLETILITPDIPKEKMEQFLHRCFEQSNRLTRLLRDISVLTRIDETPQAIEKEHINVTELVRNITDEVALDLEKREIDVKNLLKENIFIKGDHSLIYSIFRNLMDNVIAYAGTWITVTINCFREDEKYYYFSFSDTGVGVGPEHLQRIFERFYRVDKGRSRKLGGTGLGLAIVKNAVILHGGKISAKKNQSGGLEFIFTLEKEK